VGRPRGVTRVGRPRVAGFEDPGLVCGRVRRPLPLRFLVALQPGKAMAAGSAVEGKHQGFLVALARPWISESCEIGEIDSERRAARRRLARVPERFQFASVWSLLQSGWNRCRRRPPDCLTAHGLQKSRLA